MPERYEQLELFAAHHVEDIPKVERLLDRLTKRTPCEVTLTDAQALMLEVILGRHSSLRPQRLDLLDNWYLLHSTVPHHKWAPRSTLRVLQDKGCLDVMPTENTSDVFGNPHRMLVVTARGLAALQCREKHTRNR